ncbi:hypothetical protein [Haloarchaeobius sp. DFWS5]|uniref:hypothetical protein n=1 Tax=Haloarchaeobius sp. DFWS5 TaxID=3446114 RepID=UPI003EC10C21
MVTELLSRLTSRFDRAGDEPSARTSGQYDGHGVDGGDTSAAAQARALQAVHRRAIDAQRDLYRRRH